MIRAGRYSDAERAARALLGSEERAHGAESASVAEALDLLAVGMRGSGSTGSPEALAVCERAVRLHEKLTGRESPEYATSLHNRGALYMTNHDVGRARFDLETALHIRERVLGPEHLDVASSLLFLANLEYELRHPQEVERDLNRAVAILNAQLPEGDPQRIQGSSMLAALRYDLGDYVAASVLWHEVLAARRKALGPNHAALGETLHNLGALAVETGDNEEGLKYLAEALKIRIAVNPRQPYVAATLVVMGQALARQGKLEQALARYDQALSIQQDPVNQSGAQAAWTLHLIGDLLLRQHEDARAAAVLRRALEIQTRELGPDHADLAWTLNALAVVADRQGRRAEAESLYARSLAIGEGAYGSDYPDVVATRGQFAQFLASDGDSERAFAMALSAARARGEHLRATSSGLAERQALAYAATGSQPLDVLLQLAPSGGSDRVAAAWDQLIRWRGIVLDEMAARSGMAAGEDSMVRARARDLVDARRRYANLLVRGTSGDAAGYHKTISRARDDVESAERALAARSRRFEEIARREGIGWKDVSAALPEGWGLLAYAVHGTDGRYVAFVARRGAAPVAVSLGKASTIDPLAYRFLATLGRGDRTPKGARDRAAEASCRAAGGALRREIWDPLREPLRGIERLFVVPDGSLDLVNFAALPSAEGRYLVEDGPLLHALSSERDLVRLPRRRDGAGLLALGGAAFDAPAQGGASHVARASHPKPEPASVTRGAAEGRSFRQTRFTPLPETAREVHEIAAAWGDSANTLVLTGASASEPALKSLAPGRRVLHLATHGFFLDASRLSRPARGARGIGFVTSSGVPAGASAPALQESPLLISGLALAGANRRLRARPDQEDGILTAQEVASMDLSGAEWVVLSACDTGLGRVQAGEGVLGLRRAFEEAGAGSVLMSLWEVDDRASRDWMRELYEARFHRHRSTAESVRDADLQVLRNRRAQGLGSHPFYWAGFVATGDWR